MNYCKDCRYFAGDQLCYSEHLMDPVTKTLSPKQAREVRFDPNRCGLEGRWFEGQAGHREPGAPHAPHTEVLPRGQA